MTTNRAEPPDLMARLKASLMAIRHRHEPGSGPEHRDCVPSGCQCVRCGRNNEDFGRCRSCGSTAVVPLFVALEATGGVR